MNWVVTSLIAIALSGTSDLLRKLAASIANPFVANLFFQMGAATAGIGMFLLFARGSALPSVRDGVTAFLGGFLIATFTYFSFRALSSGPGLSTVMPILRIGGVIFTVVLGLIVLRERLTWYTVAGLLLSSSGIYLLFKTS